VVRSRTVVGASVRPPTLRVETIPLHVALVIELFASRKVSRPPGTKEKPVERFSDFEAAVVAFLTEVTGFIAALRIPGYPHCSFGWWTRWFFLGWLLIVGQGGTGSLLLSISAGVWLCWTDWLSEGPPLKGRGPAKHRAAKAPFREGGRRLFGGLVAECHLGGAAP